MKNLIYVLLLFSLLLPLASVSSGCRNSTPTGATSPVTTPPTTSPPADNPSAAPVSTPPPQSPSSSLKTEVVYFHLTQRCVTCLCFESRIKWVIDTYCKDAISDGKMTFIILNAQEKQNAAIARKYGAVGSQLFINTIIDGVDHIEDIQEIWNWNCRNDPDGFNQKVQSAIDQSLKGQL